MGIHLMIRSNMAVLCIITILYESVYCQFLRPVQSGLKIEPYRTMSLTDSISLFETIDSQSVIKIDLNRPRRQQAIVIRNYRAVKLHIYCSIYIPYGIEKSNVLTQLCYKNLLHQDAQCSDLNVIKNSTNLFNMDISVKSIRNGTGYAIIMDSVKSDAFDLSGFYYCRSTTAPSGLVLSNVLEIRDSIYWGKNLISSQPEPVQEVYPQNLNISQMPKSFKCLDDVKHHIAVNIPHWTELEFKSVVKWAFCPASKQRSDLMELEKTYINECIIWTISKCEKPEYLCPYAGNKMPGWREFTSFDGTITFVSGQKFYDFGNKLDGYALMCYYKSKNNFKPLRYIASQYENNQFTKGLRWTDISNDRKNLEAKSPMNQTIRIRIFKKSFSLVAFYFSPRSTTYEWKRSGMKMYNSSDWSLSQYSLRFSGKVNFQFGGEYLLLVKSGLEEMKFMFHVIVASPPLLVNTSLSTVLSSYYTMTGSNISITYRYKQGPINIILYINGLIYKPGETDHNKFMKDLSERSIFLKELDFSAVKTSLLDNSVELTYNVTKVSFSDTLLLSQDHSIIVEAQNTYGISRSHLNINVLRHPIYSNLPESDNCSLQCSSQQSHLFRCNMNSEYFIERNIVVEKFWMVNGMRIQLLPYYSTFFREDSNGLEMLPVNSSNSEHNTAFKLLFKDATLTCRIRLLYPDSLGLPENVLDRDKRVIFDSVNDANFMSHSAAMIKLDWEPSMAMASYTWVVFLVIALLLIIMFVFLLVRLTLRDQGKSYQIEKLEIQKGINRDEEIIENETIRPYIRSGNKKKDEANTDVSRNGLKSSTNKSFLPGYRPQQELDVIDDENELEDASKFNEEGSFIGLYASKDKLSTLPSHLNE